MAGRDNAPNYYTLLGAPCDANDATLRRCYRAASLRLHPDRQTHSTEAERAAATAAFQALQHAYDCLRDPRRRAIYDYGEPAATAAAEAACRARYFPDPVFRPFRKPAARQDMWCEEC